MELPFSDSTLAYYQEHGESFFQATAYLDMEAFYEPFLRQILKGGSILDVGCGSGRDSKAFIQKGFQVTALDASSKMAELASQLLKAEVLCLDVRELSYHNDFDGIWACAALLHLPESDLPAAFMQLSQALKPKGVLYCSFKHGVGSRQDGERFFTDLNESRLSDLISHVPTLGIQACWLTQDQRVGNQTEWFNALLQKS